MTVTCFKCGQQGHVASACQWQKELTEDGRPDWCGTCDRRTRLVLVTTDQGEKAARCDCHPLGGKMPRQFTRCPGCRTAIYVWDNNDCDRHQAIGARLSYHPMPDVRPHDDDIELAKRQLAEFRASRAIAWSLPADTVDATGPRPEGDQASPPA